MSKPEQKPFFAAMDGDWLWFIDCHFPTPGCVFSYNGGWLDPKSRFQTKESAEAVARFCNAAFNVGKQVVQRAMREALGIKG